MTDADYICDACGSVNIRLDNKSVDDMGLFHHVTCNDCGYDMTDYWGTAVSEGKEKK